MTILQTLRCVERRLRCLDHANERHEAECIMAHLYACTRGDMYLKGSLPFDPALVPGLDAIVRRRIRREPLAYIFGRTYFYSRWIAVNRSVLIPRPETEVLVETILHHERDDVVLFCDFGTGSGNISAVLAEHRPRWRGVGIDASIHAAITARRNCPGRILVACAEQFRVFRKSTLFDIVVSNPPYVPSRRIAHLDESVRDYEPRRALDGGKDGLDYCRMLSIHTPAFLKGGGRAYTEIGPDQDEAVPSLFSRAGWSDIRVIPDLARRPRIVRAVWNG